MTLKEVVENSFSSEDDLVLKDFQKKLAEHGYATQNIPKECKAYHDGLRCLHIIPDKLWMKTSEILMDLNVPLKTLLDSEIPNPIPEKQSALFITTEPTETFDVYINQLYERAKTVAQHVGEEFLATPPTAAAGGVMVVYLGFQQKK